MAATTAEFEAVANAIIEGQVKIMGPAAQSIAGKIAGLTYAPGTGAKIAGAGATVVDALVKEYSNVTGPLGARLCYMSAQPILSKNPDMKIASFDRF